MYSLGADSQPVTARQIQDVLGLHLPATEQPSNVSASLRKYTALASPSKVSGSLRWSLAEAGILRLRSLSGLPLTRTNAAVGYGIDVGIVCALEHPEFSAVMDALGGENDWEDAGNLRYPHLYRRSRISTLDGCELTVVGTTATSMGLTAAAIATINLIHAFQPKLVVMAGIAAGTRGGNKQFGDILVADPSVDYNSGKVVFEGGVREFLPDPYPIGLDPRLRSLLKKYSRPHPLLREISRLWPGKRPRDTVSVHVGPLGAADQVIDDETRILEIQRNWRKLIGVEMETYGVYRACLEAPDPKPRFVSLKAVCDFAAQKSDSWQAYAAFVSAQFTFGFIKAEWQHLWPGNHQG